MDVLRTIFKRGAMISDEDTSIAYRHVYCGWHGESAFTPESYREFAQQTAKRFKRQYPYGQATRMLIQTLNVPILTREVLVQCVQPIAKLHLLFA